MPTLTQDILHKVTAAIFRATGAPDDLAVQVADVLVDNHLAGHDSHGILRIPEYVQSVRAGEIVPTARPRVLKESAASALVSRNWAFGQVTAVFAAAGKIKLAKARHEQLPPDAILDRQGRPSTDPQAFFEGGCLRAFGGHKGYALAVIAELLSGPLAGADAYPGVTSRKVGNELGVDVEAVAMRQEQTHALEPLDP